MNERFEMSGKFSVLDDPRHVQASSDMLWEGGTGAPAITTEKWVSMVLGAIKQDLGLTVNEFFGQLYTGQLEFHPAASDFLPLFKSCPDAERALREKLIA